MENDSDISNIAAPESSESLPEFEPFPLKYAYMGVLSSLVAFQLINYYISQFIHPKTLTVPYGEFRNMLVSCVHAVFSGSLCLFCCFYLPELFQDLIAHVHVLTFSVVCISLGYFIYDATDIMRIGQVGKNWQLMVHHVVIITMFGWNALTSRCLGYNIVGLLAEVNSMFLHIRKLFHMLALNTNTCVYRCVAFVNVFTFLVFRFGSLVVILWGMLSQGHRVPPAYMLGLIVSMIVMGAINPVLFWRVWRSDFLAAPRSARVRVKPSDRDGALKTVDRDAAAWHPSKSHVLREVGFQLQPLSGSAAKKLS